MDLCLLSKSLYLGQYLFFFCTGCDSWRIHEGEHVTIFDEAYTKTFQNKLSALKPYWKNDEIVLTGQTEYDKTIFEILLDCQLDKKDAYKGCHAFFIRPFVENPNRNHWDTRNETPITSCILHATAGSLINTLCLFTKDINDGSALIMLLAVMKL